LPLIVVAGTAAFEAAAARKGDALREALLLDASARVRASRDKVCMAQSLLEYLAAGRGILRRLLRDAQVELAPADDLGGLPAELLVPNLDRVPAGRDVLDLEVTVFARGGEEGAVTISTGISRRCRSLRTASRNSKPSMTGISRSSRTRSGR